jgi:hypothetical protein
MLPFTRETPKSGINGIANSGKEIDICQVLPGVKVRVAARAAALAVVRAAAAAREEAAAAVFVRAPAASASARPAVKKRRTSRESPVLKSSVLDAGQ